MCIRDSGGGDGDVEGVEVTEHRDADAGVGDFPPEVGQAGGFGAHHNRGRLLHIRVVVAVSYTHLAFALRLRTGFICWTHGVSSRPRSSR